VPARSLLSTIIGHTAAGCVCLGVLHQLVLRVGRLLLVPQEDSLHLDGISMYVEVCIGYQAPDENFPIGVLSL
jgi:hypothetical protein